MSLECSLTFVLQAAFAIVKSMELAAAKVAVRFKRKIYERVLEQANIPENRFIPFAIESTGRFGDEALALF